MFKISKLKPEDVSLHQDSLIDLLWNNHQINFPEHQIEREDSTCRIMGLASYLHQGKAILFGAFQGDCLIGFLWGFEKTLFGRSRLHLNEIIVAEQHRGHGIGKQLVQALIHEAETLGLDAIELFCSAANSRTVRIVLFQAVLTTLKKVLSPENSLP